MFETSTGRLLAIALLRSGIVGGGRGVLATNARRMLAVALFGAQSGCTMIAGFDEPPSRRCDDDADCAGWIEGSDPCVTGRCNAEAWCVRALRDADGDGHADRACAALDAAGTPDDCDDADPAVHPGAAERCNAVDDDCGGAAETTTEGDAACVFPATRAECRGGRCEVLACDAPFDDCNEDGADGCEADLTSSPAHCGACGASCGAGGTCEDRACDAIVELAAGARHACARRANGRVVCWGNNEYGQLGAGDDAPRRALHPQLVDGVEDAVGIVAGQSFACALRRDRTVACWGSGNAGELGNGLTRCCYPPGEVVGLRDVTAIGTGWNHACAQVAGGLLHCWGSTRVGVLGTGDGYFFGSEPLPVAIDGVGGVISMAGAFLHTCVAREDGTALCTGSPSSGGELGNGCAGGTLTFVPVVGEDQLAGVVVGQSTSCGWRRDGTVACWGAGGVSLGGADPSDPSSRCVPFPIPALSDVVEMTMLDGHACARTSAGAVLCAGKNEDGELGRGTTSSAREAFAPVPGLDSIVSVAAGARFTCALRARSEILCWGDNSSGQLGDGTTESRAVPAPVSWGPP